MSGPPIKRNANNIVYYFNYVYKSLLSAESPVPLQFTPFLGILAGIVVTILILILTIIIVIKIKYRYGKSGSTGSSSEPDQDNHYRSFKANKQNMLLSF